MQQRHSPTVSELHNQFRGLRRFIRVNHLLDVSQSTASSPSLSVCTTQASETPRTLAPRLAPKRPSPTPEGPPAKKAKTNGSSIVFTIVLAFLTWTIGTIWVMAVDTFGGKTKTASPQIEQARDANETDNISAVGEDLAAQPDDPVAVSRIRQPGKLLSIINAHLSDRSKSTVSDLIKNLNNLGYNYVNESHVQLMRTMRMDRADGRDSLVLIFRVKNPSLERLLWNTIDDSEYGEHFERMNFEVFGEEREKFIFITDELDRDGVSLALVYQAALPLYEQLGTFSSIIYTPMGLDAWTTRGTRHFLKFEDLILINEDAWKTCLMILKRNSRQRIKFLYKQHINSSSTSTVDRRDPSSGHYFNDF